MSHKANKRHNHINNRNGIIDLKEDLELNLNFSNEFIEKFFRFKDKFILILFQAVVHGGEDIGWEVNDIFLEGDMQNVTFDQFGELVEVKVGFGRDVIPSEFIVLEFHVVVAFTFGFYLLEYFEYILKSVRVCQSGYLSKLILYLLHPKQKYKWVLLVFYLVIEVPKRFQDLLVEVITDQGTDALKSRIP